MAALSNVQIVYVYFFIIFMMFLSFIIRWSYFDIKDQFWNDGEEYFQWGKTFPSSLQSNITDNSCVYEDQPICCALIDSSKSPYIYPRRQDELIQSLRSAKCETVREYIPSPYEQTHLSKAKDIGDLTSENERREAIADFIFDDLKHVPHWLARIKVHMEAVNRHEQEHHTREEKHSTPQHIIPVTEEDLEYLSRYKVTRICNEDIARAYTWYEWIEPITIYTRHPYSLLTCMNYTKTITFHGENEIHYQNKTHWLDTSSIGLINADYVLLQSLTSYEESIRFHPHRKHHVSKRYFFDVGSSTFDSSLNWFLCAYLQKGIDFDQIYAWEATLLEPNDFWRRVPPRILPFLHYFNIPMPSPYQQEEPNIFTILEQIASEDDFVSIKLDIDRYQVEIPLVVALLNSLPLMKVVDEFFFELHYRCEFLMYCGWGEDIPYEYDSIILDRYHAMRLFQKLREMGIRAHVWP